MDYKQLIWNWLKQNTEITEVGIAAIMGNMQAESSFVPNIVQRGMGIKLTDAEYTAQVDSGEYAKFTSDSVGYGLCQWTYWSRKEGLLRYAQTLGTSVGDYVTQLKYMLTEGEWKSIANSITYVTDLYSATCLFCAKFENPAVQNNATRYSYAQAIYNELHGTGGASAAPADPEPETDDEWLQDEIDFLNEEIDRLTERRDSFKARLAEGGQSEK